MKPFIIFIVFFTFLTTILNARCTYGHSSALVKELKHNKEVDTHRIHIKYTEFPSDYQEVETTTYNVTLDTRLGNDTDRNWRYSSLRLRKWFEYYNDTASLIDHISNETSCAHVISDTANQLDDKIGIWISCYDPTLDEQCIATPPCYPEIRYTIGYNIKPLRTVKINLSLRGLAIIRLTIINERIIPTCFDYSLREYPFSHCKHIQVEPTDQWVTVTSGFDGYDSQAFSTFTVSLIARFKNDVALVDKIEATDFLLCSYAEGNCTTTPPGPTRSTSTWTWPPITTRITTTFPPTTMEPTPTTDITSSTTSRPIMKSILDTKDDQVPIENGWEISPEIPRLLEYYKDSNSLKDHSENTSTCAYFIPSPVEEFLDVEGIWASCADSQVANCSDKLNASCHPFINYNAPKGNFIFSVKATFHFQNLAILRLHVGDECVDYSFEETFSTCKYMKILPDGNYWIIFYWTSRGSSYYEKLTKFRLELIPRSVIDALLIDKIQVEYRNCNNDNCTSDELRTTPVVVDLTDTTTTYYTTTNESGPPPVITEDASTTITTSNNSEGGGTSDTGATTSSTKSTDSRSLAHSVIPTESTTLLVVVVIIFFCLKN